MFSAFFAIADQASEFVVRALGGLGKFVLIKALLL